MVRSMVRETFGSMKPTQDLVVAGFVGSAGARIIATMQEETLLQWFSIAYIRRIKYQDKNDIVIHGNSQQWQSFGATACEPIGEGGIYTALWNLSGAYGVGIEFKLHQIPVRQETIEICERYDLNPYRLFSDHCFLLVADNGGHLVETLANCAIPAVVIGRVNCGIKREIVHGEERGFLDRPKKDELKKVVPSYFLHHKINQEAVL
ncbi:MAG: AIR synthase-related protein [Hungatella sp.]